MAIGDFWDSSYNPSYQGSVYNQDTGKFQWLPDMSDEVRQKEVGTLQSRNRGRFCDEGCGCVSTYCDSLLLAKGQYGCHLPPELAITIVKNTNGRYDAKRDIEGGGGETIHLKYSNGQWRGRRCCTHNAYGELNYACDPCKVTTTPSGKPSECHPTNNKYKNFDDNQDFGKQFLDPLYNSSFENKQILDEFPIRDDFDYDEALRGESNWPRVGENAWLKLSVYWVPSPTTGTDLLKASPPTAGYAALCFDASGLPVEGISNEAACEVKEGYHWSPTTPVQLNHGIDDEFPDDGGHLQLIGTNEHQTKFSLSVKTDEVITNIKSRERIIKISEDGFLSGYTINNGANPDETRGPGTLTYNDPEARDSGCLEDGSTPLKKRPYCRSPITGKREQQRCEEGGALSQAECEATKSSINGYCSISDPVTQEVFTDEASCDAASGEWTWENNKWLKDDKLTCEIVGSCLKPEESKKQAQEERIVEPYCLDIATGTKDPVPQNKGECEAGGTGIWKLEDNDSCEASYKSGPAACNDSSGKESGHADKESCLVAGNTWMQNEWVSNQWVDWEYEKLSCCGQVIIDETYPSRVPQVSGSTLNARKNATCTTPYHEVILSPYQEGQNSLTNPIHDCKAAINQYQRDDDVDTEFFFDTRSYWTLLIRPCNFVGGCFDENVKRPDPSDLTDTPSENYYDTTCGEEIVLYLSTDQLVNCSNLNLTIENEHQIRSGWPEVTPMWHTSIGDKKGNPAMLQFLMPGADSSMVYGGSSEYSFPGDAMYKNQYRNWCSWPDVNVDGTGDGSEIGINQYANIEGCKSWHYWNSGKPKFQLDNPKGVDAFYAFNLQPQPFKATEEKQNRAKTLYHTAVDHRAWENCASHALGSANGGGHWFWNYGPDYFQYYDFVGWDEVSMGKGNSISVKEGGKCSAISKAAKAYVDNTVGFLRHGDCGYGNGILWVGWVPYDAWVNNKLCPDCTAFTSEADMQPKAICGTRGSCQQQDGSFLTDQDIDDNCDGIGQCITPIGTLASYNSESACENNGGTWVPAKYVNCCEWFEECTNTICTNFDEVQESRGLVDCVYRDAINEAECVCEMSSTCAQGEWNEGCIPTKGQREEDQACSAVEDPPEELVDIVLGQQVGTCVLHKDDGSGPVNANITDMTQEECGEESIKMHCTLLGVSLPAIRTQLDCAIVGLLAKWEPVYSEDPPPKFEVDTVGHWDSKYPRRENSVVKLRKAGPLTSEFADISSLKEGFKTISGRFPAGDELENPLNYWHQTGLYPKPEVASYVSDGCVGISHEGRIEHASNTTPIKITSRSHGLANGDLLMTRHVLGNFAANVWLTNRDVKETQWEDKLYSECTGDGCDNQVYPTSECLYKSTCLDSNGKETGETSKYKCTAGSCKDANGEAAKTDDGAGCESKADCEFPREKSLPQDNNGDCPDNYTKDTDRGPGEPDGCILQGEPGCDATWSAGGNTYEETCPDEYLECYGTVESGQGATQYAPFVVVKNATADTFDLYTCDNLPLDGSLSSDAIANLPYGHHTDRPNRKEVDSHGTPVGCGVKEGVNVCWWAYGNPMQEGYFGGENNPINPPPLSIFTEVVEDGAVNNGKPTIGAWAARCVAYDTGKGLMQPAKARSDYKFNPFVTVTGAPISENYTCGGTILEGGHWCGSTDVIPAPGGDGIRDDCDIRLGTWETEQDMADNVLTTAIEEGGKEACESYGLCNVIKNAWQKTTRSLTTQSDCIKLAKVWHTYDLDQHFDSKSQIYVERCQDADGNIDNSARIQNAPNIKEACETLHGSCHEPASGEKLSGYGDKITCERLGFEWRSGVYIKQASDCVDSSGSEDDDNTYKACWEVNVFSPERASGMASGGKGNAQVLPNYPMCPYTGVWNVFHKDPGVEAGYVNESDFDSLYRFGWGGLTRRWEDRANDYYIQIEQKGICPVCCDHFLPEKLTATLYDTDSNLQDFISCEMDPCEAKDYVYNPENRMPWGYTENHFTSLYDGYCCSDFYHPCDFGMNDKDLWDCYADPTKFGRCEITVAGFAPKILPVYDTDGCDKKGAEKGGTVQFFPLTDGNCQFPNDFEDEGGATVSQPSDTNKNQSNCEKYYCSLTEVASSDDPDAEVRCGVLGGVWMQGTWLDKDEDEVKHTCQEFMRKRITVNGVSNCRQCSKLYSDKDKIPLKHGPDNTDWDSSGRIYDANDDCCECVVNERDHLAMIRYPSCEEAIDTMLPDCTFANLGEHHTLGTAQELEATCKYIDLDPGSATGAKILYWSFEPCQCYPNFVPHHCEGDYIQTDPGSSCDLDGIPNPNDNEGGCRDASHHIIPTKTTAKGTSCKDKNGDIIGGITDQNTCEAQGHVWNTTEKDCDKGAGESFYPGASKSCWTTRIKTDADASQYDYPKAAKHQYHTCPGLGALDVDLNYDGSVWRSDWTIMNDVGTKQCKLFQHRHIFSPNCKSTGADPSVHKNYKFLSAFTLVAVNADCGSCDAAQYAYEGVRIDGQDWWNGLHRDHGIPSLPRDGHFIRLVMGCGNSIPSITHVNPTTQQGGFGGNIPNYRDNGIGIYAQIANCNFYGDYASESLKVGRSIDGVAGNPPCAGSTCISKKTLVGEDFTPANPPKRGDKDGRKYTFAGRCIRGLKECGNSGPCAGIKDCCTYTGADQALHAAPLWSGAVACTSGGDLQHKCSAWGYDPYPYKPAESFTVYYVKNIDPATGQATLVVNTGIGCAYPKGAIVSIGQAELMDAEFDDFGSTSRNNMSRNPFLPAGATHLLSSTISVFDAGKATPEPYCSVSGANGTVCTNLVDCELTCQGDWIIPNAAGLLLFDPSAIPKGGEPRDLMDFRTEKITSDPAKNEGIPDGRGSFHTLFQQRRGNSPFMEITVADITPLITKNPRQNRHLKIFDRSGLKNSDTGFTETGPNMLADNEKAFPFGNNPWPVGVQNHSSLGSMWPKGVPMGWENTEHLRKDPTGTHHAPGRVGLLPDSLNLNMLSRYDETVDDGSTAVPIIWPAETVMIDSIENVYANDQESGYCVGADVSGKKHCQEWEDTDGNKTAVWVPDFLYTKVITGNPHDVKDGEKIIISGSVTYQATCVGARLGYCHGNTGMDINECMKGVCRDVQHPAGFGIAGGKLTKYDHNPELMCNKPAYNTKVTCEDNGGRWASHPWNNEFDCMKASQQKEQDMLDNGWDPDGEITKDLVFTPNGTWSQSYEDDEADKQLCEAFGGEWMVGKTNNVTDRKGFYEDPLNESPKELTNREKDFTEGCPVNCELNGFAVQDACTSHYSEPPGNCYECLLLKVLDDDGEFKEEARCPRAVHDGAYIARTSSKRYCQNSDFNPVFPTDHEEGVEKNAKHSCIQNGWEWYGDTPLNEKYEIALHHELNMDFADGSKIWGDQQVPQRAIDKGRNIRTDWMLDPEVHEGYIEDNLGDFTTEPYCDSEGNETDHTDKESCEKEGVCSEPDITDPIDCLYFEHTWSWNEWNYGNTAPSSAIEDKNECEHYREHAWIDTTPLRPPSGFSSTPTEGASHEFKRTEHAFSSAFGTNASAGLSAVETTGQCINIRKIRQFMDGWSPQMNSGTSIGDDVDKFLEENVDGNATRIISGLQDACSRSDNCTLRTSFGWCMNLDEQMQGTCYEYNYSTSSWREITSSGYCQNIPNPATYVNKGDCTNAGGNWIWNNIYKDCSDIFIGDEIDPRSNTLESKMSRTEACATKGMKKYGGSSSSISSTAVIPDFVCAEPQDPKYQPSDGCSIPAVCSNPHFFDETSCIKKQHCKNLAGSTTGHVNKQSCEENGTCSESILTDPVDCLAGGHTWTWNKWTIEDSGFTWDEITDESTCISAGEVCNGPGEPDPYYTDPIDCLYFDFEWQPKGKWIKDHIPPEKSVEGAGMTERVCKEIALGYPIYRGHCNNSDANSKSACPDVEVLEKNERSGATRTRIISMWQPAIDPAPEHPMSVMPTYTATYKCHNEYCSVSDPSTQTNYPDSWSCVAAGGDWIVPPPITNEQDCIAGGNQWLEDEPTKRNKGLDLLTSLSSPEAIAMGHETGIGIAPRNYKGVIYAPNVEKRLAAGTYGNAPYCSISGTNPSCSNPVWFNKTDCVDNGGEWLPYTVYSDEKTCKNAGGKWIIPDNDGKTYTKYGVQENERAVWSRHGGSFDILVGYPPPENNCHDANANTPTNLNWDLQFEQICCNVRGPLSYYKCAERCWHHYYGPVVTDLSFDYGTTGLSHLKVNVHEQGITKE
jgi:hypothetical protein